VSNAMLAACGDVHSQSSVFLLLSVFLFLECTVWFSVCIKSRRYLSSIATVAHFVSMYTHCMRIFFFRIPIVLTHTATLTRPWLRVDVKLVSTHAIWMHSGLGGLYTSRWG